MVTSSIGSYLVEFSSLIKTLGLDTDNSKPSLRIVSIKTPSCNSPLPPISNESFFSFSLKVIATLVSDSAISLSLIMFEVTFLPSWPAKGELLTVIVIDIVGGSIGVDLMGLLIDKCEIVSATEHFVNPAMQIISPAITSVTGTLLLPSKVNNFVNLPFSKTSPSRFIALTESLTFAEPLSTFPVKHLPKKGSESKRLVNIVNGSLIFEFGGGTVSIIKSNNCDKFFFSSFISFTHQPSLPDAYKIGKSSCSSVASKDKNKSKTSSNTSLARLSLLSILLIITIGFKP